MSTHSEEMKDLLDGHARAVQLQLETALAEVELWKARYLAELARHTPRD